MRLDPAALSAGPLAFLGERRLATLTTLRADGRPHVVPVGFTYDVASRLARVITDRASVKARNASRGGPAVLCQVDGRRWLSLEGPVSMSVDPDDVADAEARYASRYRVPRVNPTRAVLVIAVVRLTGNT